VTSFLQRNCFSLSNYLSRDGFYHQTVFFTSDRFLHQTVFYIRPFFFSQSPTFFLNRPLFSQSPTFFSIAHKFYSTLDFYSCQSRSDGFRIFRTAIRRFRVSAIRRNGSRQTDQDRWFEENRRRGVCLRQTSSALDAIKLAKRQRWHVFLYEEKCLVRLHHSYSTFLC